MKHRPLLLLTAAALALAACDQSAKQEAAKLAEERAALERDKAELAAQQAAAQQAANEQERARLDSERAALELEKAKLSANKEERAAAEHAMQVAAERERRLAAERKAADETTARQAAELREREARMTAEQSRAAADQARAAVEQAQAAAGEAADQARAAQTVDFFFDALDPYGEWVQVERYGYAFRPSAAHDPRWRPYTDGGWVFTEYGWTWRSEEPFGWATYHYGRWARAPRLGWVWIPSTEWGPAWVSWRRSDEYVGWAPLPPDAWSPGGFNAAVDSYYDIGPGLYVFLRIADFGERSYRDRCVEAERNVTIINQTVNVTKVSYQKVQNNVTIVNNGPDITIINQASRRPVQRLAVERLAGGAPQPAQIVGNVLKLAAPMFKNVKPGAKPKAVKGDVKAAELDHGWREAKGEEPRFREEAKQAARRAEDDERAPVKAKATPVPPVFKPEPRPATPPEPAPATPPKRIRVIAPATPLATPLATPTPATPAPATPPIRQRPAVLGTPPPLRPAATPPPVAPRAAATPPGTPKLRAPRLEGMPLTPPPRGLPGNPPARDLRRLVPGGTPFVATPKPGELQPGAPLR